MFLADTNIFSEMTKPRPDARVVDWLHAWQSELLISAVTIAELQSGISQLAEGRKKRRLQEWLDDLRRNYRDVILSFDEAVAVEWGRLDADLRSKGRKMPARDSFLAATARHHDLTIATRNEKDFVAAGVKTLNPWQSSTAEIS